MRRKAFPAHPNVEVAFTGREEGSLAVHTAVGPSVADALAARASVARELELAAGSLAFMNQVHSPSFALTGQTVPSPPIADALIDPGADYANVVLTADCVPIALAGTQDGDTILSVIHAGRPGLLTGVINNVLDELGARKVQDLEAWIGPAICGRCYEVPEELAESSEEQIPGIRSRTRWDTPSLDLPAAVRSLLERAGATVYDTEECTFENQEWFSYRGEDTRERNATIVWKVS